MKQIALKWELKSCNDCRKVWQSGSALVNPYDNTGKENYYDDFPHYGLTRAKCPKCKENNYVLNT